MNVLSLNLINGLNLATNESDAETIEHNVPTKTDFQLWETQTGRKKQNRSQRKFEPQIKSVAQREICEDDATCLSTEAQHNNTCAKC